MAVNIGPKIGIEGEAEYRKNINQIIQQAKTLRSDMKAVESQFDENATAQEKAAAKAKILNDAVQVQKDKVAAVSQMYEKSKEKLGENAAETLKWKQALNNSKVELADTEKELKETEKAANDYGEEIEEGTKDNKDFTASIGDMMANEKLADFFQRASDAVGKFADSAIGAAKELDVGYDTIVTKTGATGAALDELKASANNIFGEMPVEMADIGAAVGEVSTRFGQTGAELEQTSKAFLQFSQITGKNVSDAIDSTDRVMKIFGVDASNTENILGLFAATSQRTGISTDKLLSALDTNGATFNELGISVENAADMLAEFELNGVDTGTVMTALKKAITNAAKSGKDAGSVLSETADRIKNAATETEALQIASEVFGTRGAVAMVDGLRSGRISLDDTAKSLENYGDVVSQTYEATISPWDKTTQMLNNVKMAGSNLAGSALSTLEPALTKITGVVQKAADGFEKLPEGVQTTIGAVTGVGMIAAKVVPQVLSFVNTVKSIKTASEVAKSMSSLSSSVEGATGAQKAFNLAVLANPLVLLTAGLVAATAAVAGIAYALADADAGAVSFRESAEALAGTLSESASSAMDQATASEAAIAQMNAQNQIADDLTATVEKLSSKEHKSKEEVDQLRKAVKDLNAIYPELNLQYDEATDSLNMSNEAMREQIALARQNAEVQAYAKIYQEQLENQLRLETDELALTNQISSALEEYGDVAYRVSKRGGGNQIFNMDELKTVSEANKGVKALSESLDENQRAQEHSQALLDISRQKLEEYGQTVDPVTGEVRDMNGEIVGTAEASEDATESMSELTTAEEETGAQTEATAEEIAAANEKIRESYVSAADSAHDSIMSQKSLWDELEAAEETSIEAMRQGLQSHIEAYRTYNTNASLLLTSQEYKTDEAFRNMVNSVIAGGMELAPELAAISQAFQDGDAALSDLVDGYGEMDQLAVEFGANTAAAATAAEYGLDAMESAFTTSGVPDAARGMVSEVSKVLNTNEPKKAWSITLEGLNGKSGESYETTKALLTSMEQGIEDGTPGVEQAESGITGSVDQTHRDIIAQKAKAITAGETVARGYATGIQNGGKGAAEAMRAVYRSGVPAVGADIQTSAKSAGELIAGKVKSGMDSKQIGIKSAGESFAGQYIAGVNAKQGDASAAGASVANAVRGHFESLQNSSYMWGYHMIENFNNGIRALTPKTAEAAKGVAEAVKRYLGHTTPEAGPLKNDDVWGLHLAENIAAGMLAGIPQVSMASYDLARAASPAYIDPDMIGGYGLDPSAIYEAVRAGAAEADTTIVIGNREFARILRDVGGAA